MVKYKNLAIVFTWKITGTIWNWNNMDDDELHWDKYVYIRWIEVEREWEGKTIRKDDIYTDKIIALYFCIFIVHFINKDLNYLKYYFKKATETLWVCQYIIFSFLWFSFLK